MKRLLAAVLFLAVASLFVGCTGFGTKAKSNYEVSVAGPAKLDKKGSIEISGKGFAPNSTIVLLLNAGDIKSDIGDALKPAPVADAAGAWKTTWSYGRMVKKKIITAGAYNIDVANEDYEKMASVSVSFAK